MDLELSEDEAALRDNVRTVLAGICPPAAVRAVFEGKGDAASIWSRMVELDWPGLGLPEEAGGLGMGYVAVALVAEELGRAVAPGSFLATVTQFAPAVHELTGAVRPAGPGGGRRGHRGGGAGRGGRLGACRRRRHRPPRPQTGGCWPGPSGRCSTAPTPTRCW